MFISRVKASDDRSPYGNFWFEPVGQRSATGMRITPDRALALPVVFACVRVLAESFAVLPMRLYRTSNGKRMPITDHWLYDLLNRRPNKWQTPFEWREMLQGHLAMRGNAYCQIISNRQGQITDLIPLHPDRIKIEFVGDSGDYRYVYTDRSGAVQTFVREELWHLRGLSSDGIVGLSPLDLAREAVGLGLAAQDYGSRFFQNDAKPGGGWIEFPGNFKDKSTKEGFRESFQDAQTGINRHKTAVLEYGMKYHEIGLTNTDSQFLESRQWQVSEIARMFRVPPHLVGDLSKATFSNIEQQSLDFVIHVMTPWAERWESSIESNLLLVEDADVEAEYDFAGLLRGDQAARGAFYHAGILDGWLVRNEARVRENYEPLPGLDKPLMPANMMAIDENGDTETPPPGAKAPAPAPGDSSAARVATALQQASAARMTAFLRGNAARMARRIVSGGIATADLLADALAIPVETAAAWLAETGGTAWTEDTLTAALITLGSEP